MKKREREERRAREEKEREGSLNLRDNNRTERSRF